MKQYFKNILRTIIKNKGSYAGAVIIITFGVFIFVAMSDTKLNLQQKVDTYYDEYNFADIFATVSEMPENKIEELMEIEGIEDVFGRLSSDVRLNLPFTNEIITLHLIGYDKDDSLNKLQLDTFDRNIPDRSFVIGNKMQEFYNLQINDSFEIIINGDVKKFQLAGTVKGPQYIYVVPSSGAQMSDNEIYDIGCIQKNELEKLLNKSGKITDIGIKLKDGYTYNNVKYYIEKKLEPYGLWNLTDRKNQESNSRLEEEISQLVAIAMGVPIIFMSISVFMMYIVIRKIIEKERSLIGTMKAFGFTNKELLFAYMKQSLLIGFAGGILSSILSIPFGKFMFNMYTDFFSLPYNDFKLYVNTRIYGMIIAVLTSMLSTYLGVKNILDINPAESMRQISPPTLGNFKIPNFLIKYLNSMQKMSIREIMRNKKRNLVIMLAIALPFSIEAVLMSVPNVTDKIFFNQFTKIQTYDMQVVYKDYQNYYKAVSAFKSIDNIYNIEGIVTYPINIKKDNISKNTALVGLNKGSTVYRIMDIYENYYEPSNMGIIINNVLAEKIGVKKGDIVEVTINLFSDKPTKIPIKDIIVENFGELCYINIDAITKFFDIPKATNSVVFNVEKGHINDVKKILSESKYVVSLTDVQRTLKGYRDIMQNMVQMLGIFSVLGIVTGIVVIYNILDISMRDRKNEFGTLTILGISSKEIAEIISFEQIINFFGGVILGIPISWVFRELVSYIIATDVYTIKLDITLSSYFLSLCICFVIVIITSYISMKNINNTDLTDILKERE